MRRVALAAGVALVLTACGTSGPARPAVVASFYPLAEVASRVAGPGVVVRNLTPAGAEPHELELTPRQVDELLDAELVVYMGRGFQPAVSDVLRRRKGASLDVLRGFGQGADPHVWLDPVLMKDIVASVEAALVRARPDEAAAYARRARAYTDELDGLNEAFAAGLQTCERRIVVTSHAAFGHLAARYGLTQRAIAGVSPEAEPDPRRLAEIADLVTREHVTTVFTETLVSQEVADTLARETGVRTAVLNPLEGLTRAERAAGKTYAAVMRDNLAVLRSALSCR